jgi:chromate transporter
LLLAATPALLSLSAASGPLVALGLFFAKAGAFIFGSGLAVVPFLREGVVHQHHWLDQRQFLDAVAMGLLTPGPVVISATFIGYLIGGLAGALVATVAIFAPIYLGVVVPGRWFVRHRDHPQVAAFVKGATAAAAGAIAGATVVLTRQAVTGWPTAAIALVALSVLWRFKVPEPLVVVGGALAGLLLHNVTPSPPGRPPEPTAHLQDPGAGSSVSVPIRCGCTKVASRTSSARAGPPSGRQAAVVGAVAAGRVRSVQRVPSQ